MRILGKKILLKIIPVNFRRRVFIRITKGLPAVATWASLPWAFILWLRSNRQPFNYQNVTRCRAEGISQEPLIPSPSIIGFAPCAGHELWPGDLAVFKGSSLILCHRILYRAVRNGVLRFYPKGDNSLFADGWITENQLLGKVVEVNGAELTKSVSTFTTQWYLARSRFGDWVVRFLHRLKLVIS